MYQIPVNDLTKLRKARKQVKIALEDIGLEYCKEAANEFEDFNPGEEVFNETEFTDICVWHPSFTKIQNYRSRPYCCRECRFSSATYAGYKNHFRHAHKRLIQDKVLLNCSHCTFVANKRTLEIHVRVFHKDKLDQQISRLNAVRQRQVANKFGGSTRSLYFCKKCNYRDSLYNTVRRHIYREHFKLVVAPYLRMIPKSSLPNGASFNGDTILCKRCKFTAKTYESLVQHVIEYHERIGAQVTAMIGHANVVVSNFPNMSQKSSMIMNGGSSIIVKAKGQPVIGYLKPTAPVLKRRSLGAAKQVSAKAPPSTVADGNMAGVNTSQTQKWKICTVCNELFPETLYSAHFESAHKARIVWAMAKYIMKIHNFTSKCLLCNRYLPSNTLLNHLLIHGITCPQCHSAFHSVEKLLEHERQAHLNAFVGPLGSAPLTFDLTIKQNVQLHVLTFNMNESEGKEKSLSPGKVPPSLAEMQTQALEGMSAPQRDAADAGKPICPLCCTPVKESVPNALDFHLRQRHQVLQTMHPVEKQMTYKCIHCLGVYTSNMVASTITLHLVQCRAVGRKRVNQGIKTTLTPKMSVMPLPKRPLPPLVANYAKKIKLGGESLFPSTVRKTGTGDLALDPKNNEHKTFEARKKFLQSYFNQRPYLTAAEEKKLSASLWIWKSHISKHFAALQKQCKSQCEKSNMSVLLGFDMQALKKVKHDINFETVPIEGASGVAPGRLKSGIPNMARNSQTGSSTAKNICTEPILIDSDSEPEIQQTPVAKRNGDSDLHKSDAQQPGDSKRTQAEGDGSEMMQDGAGDTTQIEEEEAGDSTQAEEEEAGDSMQTGVEQPDDSAHTNDKQADDSTPMFEKSQADSPPTGEKQQGDSTDTAEQAPANSSETEEMQTDAGEKEPVNTEELSSANETSLQVEDTNA